MKRRILPVLLGILILVGWWWFSRSPTSSSLYPGYVEVNDATLRFPYPTRVLDVRVQEGESVDAGDTLMVGDTMSLFYQVKALQSELKAAKLQQKSLQIQLDHLEKTLSRMSPLEEEGIARQDMD